MRKVSLMYNPQVTVVLSLLGLFMIVRGLFINPDAIPAYLLAAVVVLPLMLWQKKYMEENIDKYVLLATNSLKTVEDIKTKGPEKAMVFGGITLILLVLTIISKIPFIAVLLSMLLILYPVSRKIAVKAEASN